MKTLYFNGNIITMAEEFSPEAVLCEDGKIVATGDTQSLLSLADRLFDLQGKTMLPAFIDGHSHITTVANTFAIADLSHATSVAEIICIMKDYLSSSEFHDKDGFIVGFGYDNNLFTDKAHPTCKDLDEITRKFPVIISHSSGHMGVCNSKRLRLMGLDESTPDPQGGRIGRYPDGSPDGFLEETAFTDNTKIIKQPGYAEMCRYFDAAQKEYFRHGITTVQDGFTGLKEWALLKKLSDDHRLKADVVCYIDIAKTPQLLADNISFNKTYVNNLKTGGYKLFLDGSPQGRTAWMKTPYENSGDYKGYPVYSDSQVLDYVMKSVGEKQQLLCHCNGDAAVQQFIDSFEKADKLLGTRENFRPVLIHGQLAQPSQMKQLRKLGIIASFFVAHIWQWGDVHLSNFGHRAETICPVNSAVKNDVVTTFHQDSPVLPPDMLHTVWCAVNRKTKGGRLLARSEIISVYDALKSITINAAYQYGEENTKGSIETGKDASFVVLSDNPLICEKDKINEIKVEYTILRDEIVYSKK
ncbi:MAG: amidohydrolase [Oscillospiraceae bacterium]|nr:amidohydrolase [Oscillospiraceae bacterium]